MGRPDRYHYLVLLGIVGMDVDDEQSLTTISGHGKDTEDKMKFQEDEIDDIATEQCLEAMITHEFLDAMMKSINYATNACVT